MSESSYDRGLRDGATGVRPIMVDADYERGYGHGREDHGARMAQYRLDAAREEARRAPRD